MRYGNRRSAGRRRCIAAVCAAVILLCRPLSTPVGQTVSAQTGRSGLGVRIAELTPQAEQAINRALKYLARTQAKDGAWGSGYRAATTAVGLMAFMLQGHFPKHGKHGATVDRALSFLLKTSKDGSGYFGQTMYQHALATLALSEVWGMSDREEIRDALKMAVRIILRSQNRAGGWRYQPFPASADISVTVMQIIALNSAKEAGMYVPQKTIDRAIAYVRSCQVPFTGGFGYTGPSGESFSASCAGVASLLLGGVDAKTRPVQAGLGYLFRYPRDKFVDTRYYYYAHYYAIQAMYQAGENYYQKWYPKIHDGLLNRQKMDGSWRGGSGGGHFSTCLAVLTLGMPYRFLPVYQR